MPYSINHIRTGTSAKAFQKAFKDELTYNVGRYSGVATRNDQYLALAYAVRDRVLERFMVSGKKFREEHSRTVCYLSAEYLVGPHLGNNLVNLGVWDEVEEAMKSLGIDLEDLLEQEEEPGLGNGGLGRLAACFMESLATLQIPAIGYGIRYEFGIFDQAIEDGWQVEVTDKWLALGNPWELPRPETQYEVKFGGRTEGFTNQDGRYCVRWYPSYIVRGMAYDTPVLGHKVANTNLLRLWKAEAAESFDFKAFNVGDYYGAVEEKVTSENITKVLYPNDIRIAGKKLRLEQQYFFTSCSLQDMIRIHLAAHDDLSTFPDKYAVQLNDTHPSVAIPELMHQLVDELGMDWEEAWDITTRTFSFTNHTLLPEALERWSVELFREILPRHLEIILEINRRFLEETERSFPGDQGRLQRLSIVDETDGGYLRMANLACVGSHHINGVAELHTELVRSELFGDLHDMFPEKFSAKTNGVTPRRFLALNNRRLAKLLDREVGEGWLTDLTRLRAIEARVDDPEFREEWRRIKLANKRDLAAEILHKQGKTVNPESLFDVQVKRFHEYKRQHLNLLHVIALYNRLRRGEHVPNGPRTVILGGKAAPGYAMAKLIIKLAHSVEEAILKEPDVRDQLAVVFIPDFNVKHSQRIFPAADLSEQISMAGKEASGTGNMKFMMNGALTIGTLDGANVEIREEVGPDNFFLFGMTVAEVKALQARGYRPRTFYERDQELHEALDQLAGGHFSPEWPDLFQPLVSDLLDRDPYMVLADFRAYVDCQERVAEAYQDQESWTRMSILNTARSGRFSSDRAIAEYCKEIWKVDPVNVELDHPI